MSNIGKQENFLTGGKLLVGIVGFLLYREILLVGRESVREVAISGVYDEIVKDHMYVTLPYMTSERTETYMDS